MRFFLFEGDSVKTFNEIKTKEELAQFLGISLADLHKVLYIDTPDSYYITFSIPKKSGNFRIINAPTGLLKSIQHKLYLGILKYQENLREQHNLRNIISHGFEPGKSIMTNALVHKNKRYVFNIDLQDFFDQFHFGRVKGFFEKNKYFLLSSEVSTVIAQLTCYRSVLPQGAPTSPIITNLICQVLDQRILKLARKYKLDYTRYADDLTFSTNDKHFLESNEKFFNSLSKIIKNAGFSINPDKTRLQYKDSRQIVTGLVVNKKVNINRHYYKETRAMADTLYRTGSFLIDGQPGTVNQLNGRFAFINQIDKFNNISTSKFKDTIPDFKVFNNHERDYQRFLFYRYFMKNEKPLIITEGKTDVRYLKAALKNMYLDYPELISKLDDGSFSFNISFLNKTRQLQYFFYLSKNEGADDFVKLCNFYRFPKKNSSNLCHRKKNTYPTFFYEFLQAGIVPSFPVIFLSDNELSNPKKPIKKLCQALDLTNEQILHLKNNCYIKLQSELDKPQSDELMQNTNIILLTLPLPNPKMKECAIEDLFLQEDMPEKLLDKPLNLKNAEAEEADKNDFSNYVLKNYTRINFVNFRPLFDTMKNIINEYSLLTRK